MPTPNAPGSFSFNDAPAGDMAFDDLFGDQLAVDPNSTAAPTTVAAGVPPTQASPEPQAPVAPEPTPYELRTATGTVYKSVEDTVRGIEQKDTLIENLRSQLALRTGVDPITQQPIQYNPAPQAPQVPNYVQDPKKYMEDLVAAAESNDPSQYAQVQQKFMLDTLAPISGIITDAAKKSAVEQIATKYNDFNTVRESPEYKAVLEDNQELKEAIAMAESDYRYHNRLGGLYKIAYEAAQGRRVPEIMRQMQTQTPTPQPARPTNTASALPPPEPGVRPDVRTAEGRKALIAQFESQGVQNLKW